MVAQLTLSGVSNNAGVVKYFLRGVGLSGMRERVTDLSGSFDIESNSHGTAVIVALPLRAQPSGEAPVSQGNLRKNSEA